MSKPSVMVGILTFRMEKDGNVLESQRLIDHNEPSDRQWLAKHCWWAARNGRMVSSVPEKF